MNAELTAERFDAYLVILERAIVLARSCSMGGGDVARAEAILDAVHNLPRFLIGNEYKDFEREFRSFYLAPLVKRYPDLEPLVALCPS